MRRSSSDLGDAGADGVGDAPGGERRVLARDDGELGDDGLAVEGEPGEDLPVHAHHVHHARLDVLPRLLA